MFSLPRWERADLHRLLQITAHTVDENLRAQTLYRSSYISYIVYPWKLEHCIITLSTTVTDSFARLNTSLIVYPTGLCVWNGLLFALCDNYRLSYVYVQMKQITQLRTAVSVILLDRIFVIA